MTDVFPGVRARVLRRLAARPDGATAGELAADVGEILHVADFWRGLTPPSCPEHAHQCGNGLVRVLACNGDQQAWVLTARATNVSPHLRVLERAGYAQAVRAGRRTLWIPSSRTLTELEEARRG